MCHEDAERDADVQALVKDVNGLLDTAMEKDADLAAYVEAQKNSQNSGSTTTGDGDTGEAATGSDTATTMQATTGVNVRAEASENARSTVHSMRLARSRCLKIWTMAGLISVIPQMGRRLRVMQ